MATINPYINFEGNTEEAFNFYKSVFGGEFSGGISRWKDMSGEAGEGCAGAEEGAKLSEADGEKVMHVALPIGSANVLMGSDVVEGFGPKHVVGNNFALSLNADSKEETEKIFNGLADGAEITMPLGDTFWGAYFGMLKDKFGIQWMVNYDYPKE